MSENIVLRYTPTTNDYIQQGLASFRNFLKVRSFGTFFFGGLLLIILIIILLLRFIAPAVYSAESASDILWDPLWMVIALFFCYCFYFCFLILMLRRRFHSEIIFEINDNGIVAKTKFAETSLVWATFQEVIETEKLYMLRARSFYDVYFIPKRIFENSNQESAFRNMIRSHITKVRLKD